MSGPSPSRKIPAGSAFLLSRDHLAKINEMLAAPEQVMDERDFAFRDAGSRRYISLRKRGARGEGRSGTLMPFEPLAKKEGSQWYAALAHGHIIEVTNPGPPVFYFHTVAGVSTEHGEPVWHAISPGNKIYINFAVKIDGKIDTGTPPEMVIGSDPNPNAEHYHPEVGHYLGRAGLHQVEMCTFELVDNAPRFSTKHCGDHIHFFAERATLLNRLSPEGESGDRREWVDEYEPGTDRYWFRYLLQLAGDYDGKPVVKPLPEGTDPDTYKRVDIRLIAERLGGLPAIRVKAEADWNEIRIEGNDIWHNFVFQECAAGGEGPAEVKAVLAIRDGLCYPAATEAGAPPVPEDRELGRTEITYANCHCCGEGV